MIKMNREGFCKEILFCPIGKNRWLVKVALLTGGGFPFGFGVGFGPEDFFTICVDLVGISIHFVVGSVDY